MVPARSVTGTIVNSKIQQRTNHEDHHSNKNQFYTFINHRFGDVSKLVCTS